uniref:Uncharacterized protein n=2 Tax=Oryza TaxID=4527 RepID=A0A0D3HKH9_9ORYZ
MVDLVLNHRGVMPTREELISLSATLTVCYSNPSTAPAASSPHCICCRRCLLPLFQAMASTAFLNATPHLCQCSFLVVSTITAHSYASYLAVATVCQDELNHLAALGGDDAIVETDFLKSVSAM